MSQKPTKVQPVPSEKSNPTTKEPTVDEIARSIATGCATARTLLDPNRPRSP